MSEDSVLAKMSKECFADSQRWFPRLAHSVPYHALAMCGEAGEFANWAKKVERGDVSIHDTATHNAMAEELADVFIYMLNIAALMGIDLERVYDYKRTVNERRFSKDTAKFGGTK